MAQPEFVPLLPSQKVRDEERLPPASGWRPDRPGDHRIPGQPVGTHLGTPVTDGGYGLKLARSFEKKLRLTEGISEDDAIAGCYQVGAKRAGLFGRSPVIYDMELAFTIWGFLGDAPRELVAARKPLFSACSHHYWDQRDICDAVPEETLRLTPAVARERLLGDWRSLLRL